SGATWQMSGGTLTIASGGTRTFQSGSTFSFSSGTVDVQTGGQLTVDGLNTINSGTLQISGGTLTIPTGASINFLNGSQLHLFGGAINGGGTINNDGLVVQGIANSISTVSIPLNN